mgnify:CR=1 FL=1
MAAFSRACKALGSFAKNETVFAGFCKRDWLLDAAALKHIAEAKLSHCTEFRTRIQMFGAKNLGALPRDSQLVAAPGDRVCPLRMRLLSLTVAQVA